MVFRAAEIDISVLSLSIFETQIYTGAMSHKDKWGSQPSGMTEDLIRHPITGRGVVHCEFEGMLKV